ncbi:MAG: cytochrome P450 [Blastocatellia bacterium]
MSSVSSTTIPAPVLPPGPRSLSPLGVARRYQRDPFAFVQSCRRDYGDIVHLRFFHVHSVFVYHPDLIEEVLVTKQRHFIKPGVMRSEFLQRLVGNGLLTSEGDFWRRQRRLAQPAFHRDRINNYGQVMVDFADRMAHAWQPGQTRDIHQDMMKLTLEVVAKTLFDADVTAQTDAVGAALRTAIEPFEYSASLRWLIDNRFPTPANRRNLRATQHLNNIVYKIIDERRQVDEDRGDLLSMLLAARDEDGSRMDDRQLRDETMTIFLAGHETTALALTWAWYLLATHPEAEAKLHTELDGALGNRPPQFSDLSALPFTEMIVKEALRLYPPAWSIGRGAAEDCEIGGFRIPARTQVFMFQWAIQRDPRYFEQPDAFMPERWTPEFGRQLPRFAWFPFGGGPRLCIGYSFAMMEAVLILATIAQKYKLSLVPGQTIRPVPSITLRPEHGIHVRLEKR